MCGIAGIVSSRPIDALPRYLAGFSRMLQHRGPDDFGFLTWSDGDFRVTRDAERLVPARLALAHRRLSIVDLSERGWQPMVDATGRYAIVLNGEIYNYPELRSELGATGVRFRSDTDTEVLLNLLIQSGLSGLSRVVGMFAFAFLDARRRRLWIARDPFGIKPVFYAVREGTLAFSSEVRPLLELGLAPRVVDASSLFVYLRHAVTDHDEHTLVSGIRQLRPAHVLEIDTDTARTVSLERYWSPSLNTRQFSSAEEAAGQLRALFADSVRLHLRADVPVAATLSGGIDSSAIVSTIHRLNGGSPVATFSYIADDPAVTEEQYVDALARAIGVQPRKIHIQPEQLAAQLDSLVLTQEQPFTTTSMWAQSCVFRCVREEGFKVVLDGQGADELFAGYPVFRAARMTALIRRGRWGQLLTQLRSMSEARSTMLLQAMGSLLPRHVQDVARRLVGRPEVPDWLDATWFSRHGTTTRRPFADAGAPSELTAQLYDATVATSLPMLLRYADRNAMAVSLENRVPFLTTTLAEFALTLPDELLVGDRGTTKQLFRTAMRGVVPDAILDRKDKIGFVTPERRWFDESPALRARLAEAVSRPLPPCFAPHLTPRLRDVAAGRAPYTPEVWRCWNALRWAELLKLEFPS
ncbi:MAG TPA: asparagine synthase (glutamine-hydrolyzing) [Vicinamibacterales bacterium]|nr:asparagine synthase (glutamine-hydrolyzing) [Vicinamibacterales bacterium]